jgi:hypothetical protein
VRNQENLAMSAALAVVDDHASASRLRESGIRARTKDTDPPPARRSAELVAEQWRPLAPIAALPSVDTRELERFVAMSAALAGTKDRNRVLALFGISLQEWVGWSARMGHRLADDGTLRARYSTLLHEALATVDPR